MKAKLRIIAHCDDDVAYYLFLIVSLTVTIWNVVLATKQSTVFLITIQEIAVTVMFLTSYEQKKTLISFCTLLGYGFANWWCYVCDGVCQDASRLVQGGFIAWFANSAVSNSEKKQKTIS